MSTELLSPSEILQEVESAGIRKARTSVKKLLVLGILGGIYVAISAQASLAASYAIGNPNVARIIVGVMFCLGIILTSITGGEVFAGNCLMVSAALSKHISLKKLLSNWLVVFAGNFIGSMTVVVLIAFSGQLEVTNGLLGAVTIRTAVSKVGLGNVECIIMGLFCNIFLCLAVYMASACRTMTGKISAIFFPITIFNICNFENSVANMYYIPAGIMASYHEHFVVKAVEIGVDSAKIAGLGWHQLERLLPVALGNIIGGGIFVAALMWLIHRSEILE